MVSFLVAILQPLLKVALTWLANFVGGLISQWIRDSQIKEKAEKNKQQLIDAKTPEERDEATKNLARDSF